MANDESTGSANSAAPRGAIVALVALVACAMAAPGAVAHEGYGTATAEVAGTGMSGTFDYCGPLMAPLCQPVDGDLSLGSMGVNDFLSWTSQSNCGVHADTRELIGSFAAQTSLESIDGATVHVAGTFEAAWNTDIIATFEVDGIEYTGSAGWDTDPTYAEVINEGPQSATVSFSFGGENLFGGTFSGSMTTGEGLGIVSYTKSNINDACP